MTVAATPPEYLRVAPVAVLEATRSLLWLEHAADARRIAEQLVKELGGTVAAARVHDPASFPVDVAFGDGEPRLAAAPYGSEARVLLERYLTTFLDDARRALLLTGRVERLAESASTDVLTGLPNRRMLGRALGRLADDDVVVMLDLDHFKQINDVLGHPAGDEVLRVFGKVLGDNVRGRDSVGRYGGEEFVVILLPPSDADAFLERLRADWLVQRPQLITFSAGIARTKGQPGATLGLADEALYRAKDTGRNRWVWAAEPVDDNTSERNTR